MGSQLEFEKLLPVRWGPAPLLRLTSPLFALVDLLRALGALENSQLPNAPSAASIGRRAEHPKATLREQLSNISLTSARSPFLDRSRNSSHEAIERRKVNLCRRTGLSQTEREKTRRKEHSVRGRTGTAILQSRTSVPNSSKIQLRREGL